MDADKARLLANDWVEKHNTKDAPSEHDRQRRLRSANRTITNRGTGLIKLEGDRPTIYISHRTRFFALQLAVERPRAPRWTAVDRSRD